MVSYSEFPAYLGDLLKRVEETTRFPIRVAASTRTDYDCELRCAHKGTPFHLLKYDKQYEGSLEHFLVNSAVKILRLWDAPPEKRYVPVVKDSLLPAAEHREVVEKVRATYPWVPDSSLEDTSRFLYSGITRQVTSFPVDIRVEREIAKRIPEHQNIQRGYLDRQIPKLLPTFATTLQALIPDRVYQASSAMNYAFCKVVSELTGASLPAPVENHPSSSLGERLLDLEEEVHEAGVVGDKLVTDEWAGELGLEGWFEWEKWEEI